MATGQEPIRVGSQPPFAVPPERRDPARRLRGRLVAPVTVWTAGQLPGGAGLTVSSVLVAEGEPARLLGLIDPTSAFFEAAQETGAFVVHVLAAGDRALAERFSEVRPPIRGPFERLQVAESPWGPVLGGSRPRAACRLAGSAPVGPLPHDTKATRTSSANAQRAMRCIPSSIARARRVGAAAARVARAAVFPPRRPRRAGALQGVRRPVGPGPRGRDSPKMLRTFGD